MTLSNTPATAPTDGNSFVNDGNTVFMVRNTSGSQITVTIRVPGKVNGLTITDITKTVANNELMTAGPFDPTLFNNTDGVRIDYSTGGATVVAAAVRVPRQ